MVFGEKTREQLRKTRGVLDLRPMPALAKHVQLRALDHLRQLQRNGQRNHLVFAPMYYHRLVRNRADRLLRACQRIDPALAGRREHGAEAFLKSGPHKRIFLSLSELPITLTEDSAMAAAAMTGESKIPEKG